MSDPLEQRAQRAAAALGRLMALVARLRAPDGCPWDQAQTKKSIAPFVLEEAFEAAEAVEGGDPAEARSELGDLIFQIIFLADIFAQAGEFDLDGVLEGVEAKMIRRHPHIFGQAQAADAEAVLRQWHQIKAEERKEEPQGLLDHVPAASPALSRAQNLGRKAARAGVPVGGGGEDILAQTRELLAAPPDEDLAPALGRLLFLWAAWAAWRKVDAEAALRGVSREFLARFRRAEALVRAEGKELAQMEPAAVAALWERSQEEPQG